MLCNKSVQGLKKGCDLICLLLIIYKLFFNIKGDVLAIPTGKMIRQSMKCYFLLRCIPVLIMGMLRNT